MLAMNIEIIETLNTDTKYQTTITKRSGYKVAVSLTGFENVSQ